MIFLQIQSVEIITFKNESVCIIIEKQSKYSLILLL